MGEKEQKMAKLDADKYYAEEAGSVGSLREFKTEQEAQTFLLAKKLSMDKPVCMQIGYENEGYLKRLRVEKEPEKMGKETISNIIGALSTKGALEKVESALSAQSDYLTKIIEAAPGADKKILAIASRYREEVGEVRKKVNALLKMDVVDESLLKEAVNGLFLLRLNKKDKAAVDGIFKTALDKKPELKIYNRNDFENASALEAEEEKGSYNDFFKISGYMAKPLSGALLEKLRNMGSLAVEGDMYVLKTNKTEERNGGGYIYHFGIKGEEGVDIALVRSKPLPVDFLPKEINARYFMEKIMAGAKLAASEGAQEQQTTGMRRLQAR